MYSQSFSPRNLYCCTTQSERRNSGMSKEELVHCIEAYIGDCIDKGTFQFKVKKLGDLYLNGWPRKSVERFCQDLVLRKLHDNIKRIYGVKQANRHQIVKQMISLLKENSPKWVIRLDVRHFYESINHHRLIERFQEDGRLNFQSIMLLKNLFSCPAMAEAIGLLRGMSVSSVMSEIYMKYFDIAIRRLNGVYCYARFVDDIIIFCDKESSQKRVWSEIPVELSKSGLEMNPTKSYMWNNQQRTESLNYLGYAFFPKEKKQELRITIDRKKVNAIKSRITKTFVRFAKDGDFEMLKNRIKFLTGNFTLYNPSTLLPIKVGIYFNYNFITEKNELLELDRYFQSLLHCKTGKLGAKLKVRMTNLHRKELAKYSFVFGFENHVNHHFSTPQLVMIKNCWL